MFHPATVLLAWAGYICLLPVLSLAVLTALLVPALAGAMFLARARAIALARRTRWLLLSIALLFAFATPGLSAPGLLGKIGATVDGLALAAEHVLRLLMLLVTLALLHERLGTEGLVTGLHWLLAPAAGRRGLRERIVVRLMLVVNFVEDGNVSGWRNWLVEADFGPQTLALTIRRASRLDVLAQLLIAAATATAWSW